MGVDFSAPFIGLPAGALCRRHGVWTWCVQDRSPIMARPAQATHPHNDSGPSLRGVHFDKETDGSAQTLLTDEQRQQLTALATLISLPPRSIVYREDADLAWIFIARQGVLKAFRELPSGKRRVAAFLFPGDVFGLAENGRY